MVNFFKIVDPLRVGLILVILFLIRLPAIINGYPLLYPELNWLLIGEKLHDGFTMYKDVWHTTEPWSAWMYFFTDIISSRSQWALFIISSLFVLVQSLLFTYVININQVFGERTLLPALFYVIFSTLFVDFFTLSPVLMGMTFILLAVHFILLQYRHGNTQEMTFYCGLMIGCASMFYLPLFLFLFFAVVVLSLFTLPKLRDHFILLVGGLFPIVVTAVYYFVNDSLELFYLNLIVPYFDRETLIFADFQLHVLVLVIPALMVATSFFFISNFSNYINYQYNCIKTIIVYLVFALIVLLLAIDVAVFQLFVFVPAFSFFSSHLYHLVRNTWFREVSFWVFTGFMLLINYGILFGSAFKKKQVEMQQMMMVTDKSRTLPLEIANKKLLVIGEDMDYYKNNSLATPYLDWRLAKRELSDLNNYENVSNIYENFRKDLPDIIIDEKKVMGNIFNRIPFLKESYLRVGKTDIYTRK